MAATAPVDCSGDYQLDETTLDAAALVACADAQGPKHDTRRHGVPPGRSVGGKTAGRGPRASTSPANQQSGTTNTAAPEDSESLDPHKLAQRQKQVDFGKNTIGYQRYSTQVPKQHRGKSDPITPDVQLPVGKRQFDGQVKAWRRQLHKYDELMEEAAMEGVAGPECTKPAHTSKATAQRDASEEPVERPEGAEEVEGMSSPEEGSLDGYLDPALKAGTRKRDFTGAFPQQQGAVGIAAGAPEPKRSAASRGGAVAAAEGSCSMQQASTAATPPIAAAPAGAPTTFAGLVMNMGLPRGTGSGQPLASSGGVPSAAPPAAEALGTPEAAVVVTVVGAGGAAGGKGGRVPMCDNVIAMILGEDASCMSWQAGENSNVAL